jgi:hypothetical protein
MPFEEVPNALTYYLYKKDYKLIGKPHTGLYPESIWPITLKNAFDAVEDGYNDIIDDLETETNTNWSSEILALPVAGGKRINYAVRFKFYFPDELLPDLRLKILHKVNSILKSRDSPYTFGLEKPETFVAPGIQAGGKRVSSKRKTNKRRSSHRRKH